MYSDVRFLYFCFFQYLRLNNFFLKRIGKWIFRRIYMSYMYNTVFELNSWVGQVIDVERQFHWPLDYKGLMFFTVHPLDSVVVVDISTQIMHPIDFLDQLLPEIQITLWTFHQFLFFLKHNFTDLQVIMRLKFWNFAGRSTGFSKCFCL